MSTHMIRRGLLALLLMTGLAVGVSAQSGSQPATQSATQATTLQGFPSADGAASALTDAIRRDDDKAVSAMLGAGWRDFMPGSADDEDRLREKYLTAWDASHKVVVADDARATVEVGTTGWTLPMPIVRDGTSWRFDVSAGRKEVQARQIGRTELSVIQSLLAIADAQRDYAALDPMKTGTPAYARRLVSLPGKKDGLYWPPVAGEPESPLGPAVAMAQALGQGGEGEGYYGYRFRLIYAQGPAAAGGAYDYIVNGRMIGGFAVIAWPVRYDATGVMTFMVNQAGEVYEKDLGPDTAERAAAITSFDPDQSWDKADMTPP